MEILKQADLALQCGRHDQAFESLMRHLEKQDIISNFHLELLEKAFRFLMAKHRKAWRLLSQQARDTQDLPVVHTFYKSKITKDIISTSHRIIISIDIKVIPFVFDRKEKVRAFKLIGDAYRYIAEVSSEEEHSKATEESLTYYQKVLEYSNDCQNDVVYLRALLNFSVFFYEILDNKTKALEIGQLALKTLADAVYPYKDHSDVENISQILKENMKLWINN